MNSFVFEFEYKSKLSLVLLRHHGALHRHCDRNSSLYEEMFAEGQKVMNSFNSDLSAALLGRSPGSKNK